MIKMKIKILIKMTKIIKHIKILKKVKKNNKIQLAIRIYNNKTNQII